jgi:ferritin-like metal-binding protein YciE
LLEEGTEMMEEDGEDAVKDAGMITAAQRVEHYEMAAYGCAITFAKDLGESRVAKLLTETLAEEEAADRKLTEIAESEVNEAAMAVAGVEDEE